jgi:hypothetical protein
LPNSLAVKWGHTRLAPRNYKMNKLLATLRLSGVALSKLLRISWSINSFILMMICYELKYIDLN